MANRRMVGLLKMIRNVAFAHRSQNVQVCETKIVQGWPKLRDLAQHFD